MSLDEFIVKYSVLGLWKGIGIDTDGYPNYNKFQCMDLMHKYCQDVLGIADLRVLASANAVSVYKNFPNVYGNQLFTRIANTPTGVPQKGDIAFFQAYAGLYGADGHVCVVVDGDVNTMITFDQNYPTGSLPKLVKRDYRGILGWLRKR